MLGWDATRHHNAWCLQIVAIDAVSRLFTMSRCHDAVLMPNVLLLFPRCGLQPASGCVSGTNWCACITPITTAQRLRLESILLVIHAPPRLYWNYISACKPSTSRWLVAPPNVVGSNSMYEIWIPWPEVPLWYRRTTGILWSLLVDEVEIWFIEKISPFMCVVS
jgi:hypothetical protein